MMPSRSGLLRVRSYFFTSTRPWQLGLGAFAYSGSRWDIVSGTLWGS